MFTRKRPKRLTPAVERVVARRGDVAPPTHSSVVGSMSLSMDDPLRDSELKVQRYHRRIAELQGELTSQQAGLGQAMLEYSAARAAVPGEFVRPLASHGASEADIEAAAELLGWDDPIPAPRILTSGELQSIVDKMKAGIISEHKAREMIG